MEITLNVFYALATIASVAGMIAIFVLFITGVYVTARGILKTLLNLR